MNPILDRLISMSKPPCDRCGATMILHVKKPYPVYECGSGCSRMSVWDGIELMQHLNRTPAYAHHPFVLDPEVLAAYPPGTAPKQGPPRPPRSRRRRPRQPRLCPWCRRVMQRRVNRGRGWHWRCSGHPRCRHWSR